ncbi:MAG: DUF4249 family protein [Bacteroidales bacterium]|nr:DUF4249 family protein [Bacteroidales bacterium]
MAKYRNIATVLLTSLVAMVVSCETDPTGIVMPDRQTEGIMTAICKNGQPLVVNVYGSVPYNDTVRTKNIGEGYVTAVKTDGARQRLYLAGGTTSLTFDEIICLPDDKLYLNATVGNFILDGRLTMPSLIDIESVDTLSIDNKMHIAVTITDSKESYDYYQLQVYLRKYAGGVIESEERLECQYTHSAFSIATPLLETNTNLVGLFTDESRNGRKMQLTLDAKIDDINAAADADSTAIVVRLHHHSPEYYYFLLSSAFAEDYLLIPALGLQTAYSNVEGGYGIIAGTTLSVSVITLRQTK